MRGKLEKTHKRFPILQPLCFLQFSDFLLSGCVESRSTWLLAGLLRTHTAQHEECCPLCCFRICFNLQIKSIYINTNSFSRDWILDSPKHTTAVGFFIRTTKFVSRTADDFQISQKKWMRRWNNKTIGTTNSLALCCSVPSFPFSTLKIWWCSRGAGDSLLHVATAWGQACKGFCFFSHIPVRFTLHLPPHSAWFPLY